MRHHNSSTRLLLSTVGSAFVAGLLPTAASAQDAEQAKKSDDEIIVTAQKREQALSDVSLSVSAIGAEKLAE
jgi:outer membrane receptor protein involved in Fe transport